MSEIAVIKGHDIRDKKLADATSQSTVASTDAIEMKTTTGDQVYITRDSFVQAMASVLNSNSQSTISQLFGADANGNHAAINMSNLASVLGVPILPQNTCMATTIRNSSFYTQKVECEINRCSGIILFHNNNGGEGIIDFAFHGTTNVRVQAKLIIYRGYSDLYIPSLYFDGNNTFAIVAKDVWSSWTFISSSVVPPKGTVDSDLTGFTQVAIQKTPALDYGSLGDLASALGGTLLTRHTRLTDFDLNVLKQAVADQNLEKYGLKVGDQKTINGHTYVIAGLNPMKGTNTPYRLAQNHVGLIVIPHTTQKWNASGSTAQGADDRGAGYMNSDLHYYLKNTLLPLVETDLGAANLLGHSKLLSSAVTDGKSSDSTWEADCKICALSEVQVYGATLWSSSVHDTGEACRQLDVFRHYNHTEIFGGESWLRDVVSASDAAFASSAGDAYHYLVSRVHFVAALILFN